MLQLPPMQNYRLQVLPKLRPECPHVTSCVYMLSVPLCLASAERPVCSVHFWKVPQRDLHFVYEEVHIHEWRHQLSPMLGFA
jgi:hypothetical protein